MGKKRYIPRWISTSGVIPASGELQLDPEVFMNKTVWPFKIEHLTIFGYPMYTAAFPSTWNFWGGIAPYVTAEIGISGATDVNLVPASVAAAFGRTEPFEQYADAMRSVTWEFDKPYILSRDSGFSVECRVDPTEVALDPEGTSGDLRYGAVFHGYSLQSKSPVMLAAYYHDSDIEYGSSFSIDSADLLNDGEEDVIIRSIKLSHPTLGYNMVLGGVSWKINPLNGIKWMDDFISVSGIAPYCQHLNPFRGIQPISLTPAFDTYLFRRQRLGIQLNNALAINQPVDVTLFGYLEVE